MEVAERRTIPVPYGHHVYVVSDLDLSPSTNLETRPIREFINLLGDIDDAAIVVVAGNLFHPGPTEDLAKFIGATFAAQPQVRDAITAFTASSNHQFLALPGTKDGELRDHVRAQQLLVGLGAHVASDLVLQVATAEGVRDLAVAAGSYDLDVTPVNGCDRSEAENLEDPLALQRFVASRTLYRRLAAWVWLPVLAFLALDIWAIFASVADHLARHHYRVHVLHSHNFWENAFVALVIVAISETLVAGLAALWVQRRFHRTATAHQRDNLSEPLALTTVDGVDALEFARRVVERGGAGAVVGGAPSPALAFLDVGVCATPGPSRTVLVERRGLFGLPAVFAAVERLGVVEIEAGSTVQVRLFAGESSTGQGTVLERLAGRENVQAETSKDTEAIASWPSGLPFPMNVERLYEQVHQRTMRRAMALLVFIEGVFNVVITTFRPLRSHLHLVLQILPLEVAKDAAALTAVAGIALIMLARGLRRGQRRSWFFAVTILAVTIVAHAVRGGTIVSLVIAVGLTVALITQRRYFQATSDRSGASTTLPRLALIAALSVVTASLGIEATDRHQHLANYGVLLMACLERLVGQYDIALPDRVDDFVSPALLAIGITLIVLALYILTRPVVDRRLSSASNSRERRLAEFRGREIVRRHGQGTLDYFALRDDKQFFFFRDSLVAYAVYGGVALISPDPIGPVAERTEVFSAFRQFAEGRGWTIGIMAAGQEWLGIYHEAGLHSIYLGDEAIVNCQTFSLEGHKMKGLRQACTRLARHGYRVEFYDPATMDPAKVTEIVELISLLRWGDAERGFSMMLGRLFDPKDKGLLLTVVYAPDGRAVAVCQFVPSPAMRGYSLDLMRRDPGEHPNGLIDYALCTTIAHLRVLGHQGLSLNFAAFRSIIDGEKDGTFTRVERWALKRLSGILPIESLWSFNAKYRPTWLPRYLVYPAAESFVPVVAATLRAESITELPVIGRFFAHDPANRPGTVVPEEILAAAREVDAAGSGRR
ncbi:MAG: phosphatidylglycerol lysyltransferase domain-containing protein [Acidimicrobiales bacterium]